MTGPGVVLARVVRNGVVESVHTGSLVVCDAAGATLASVGEADRMTYVRSAVKPFQALAVLDVLDSAGFVLDQPGLAIACASHDGTDDHQIEAARLLAEADLDESALLCPPALPRDLSNPHAQRTPHPLAHNCSGKHASFLLATVLAGDEPAAYLQTDSPLQRRIVERVAEACSATPEGPGVDGCGAPAWLLPLDSLARAFARLAGGTTPELTRIRSALHAHPMLIGGPLALDSRLMAANPAIVAKRGAEAVFAAGTSLAGGVGVAVKIDDGGPRADASVAAAVLHALGTVTPDDIRRPIVLGGGVPQGAVEIDDAVRVVAARALASL